MNELQNKDTFTSLELTKQINIFRKEEGNKAKLQHYDLLKIIREEFSEEIGIGKISETPYTHPQNGQEYPMFILNLKQARQVLVRESKFVRKKVIQYIDELESKIQKIEGKPLSETQKKNLEIRERYSKVRLAETLKSLIPYSHSETYKEILVSEVAKVLTGRELLPPQQVSDKTLTATEIAQRLGTNRNKIGIIANANGLKNEKNGYWVHEKASHCNKEVPNFRYFEHAIEIFKKYL